MQEIHLDQDLLSRMVTEQGPSLLDISAEHLTLLIFLRNFGCTFCRQALKDISELKESLEDNKVKVIFVHLSDEQTASEYFEKHDLRKCYRISDPEAEFYQHFGLTKGTFKQLYGLQNWIRGFQSAMMDSNGFALPIGDGLQMPGVFVLEGNKVISQYIHDSISERPDYLELINKSAHRKETID